MKLSKVIFWDVKYEDIDWNAKPSYVIERVVSFGSLEDWHSIKEYYGVDQIKKIVLGLRHLDPKTLSFLSAFFSIPKEQFRCYTFRQSTPKHSPF